MSCPHFSKINTQKVQQRLNNPRLIQQVRQNTLFCDNCPISQGNIWVCLTAGCSFKGCGRYQKKHAMQHFQKSKHPIFMNPSNLYIYCISCQKDIQQQNSNSQILNTLRQPFMFRQSLPIPEPPKNVQNIQGLANTGNTCYMNAGLQCLSKSMGLSRFFRKMVDYSTVQGMDQKDSELILAFSDLLKGIWATNSVYTIPHRFKKALQETCPFFKGVAQHDAQEFLKIFIDKLHQSLKHDFLIGKKRSIISDSFKSQIKSRVSCLECSNFFDKIEQYFDLPLTIPSQAEIEKCGQIALQAIPLADRIQQASEKQSIWKKIRNFFDQDQSSVSLYDCLLNFCLPQQLSRKNKFFCPKCNKKCQISRQFKITQSPNCLMLFLKRFKYSGGGAKISTHVKYPKDLDLKFFMQDHKSVSYRLYGIIQHLGGMGGGHYIAYAKTKSGWYEFDDSRVRPIPQQEVLSKQAYVLFYQKEFPQRRDSLQYKVPSVVVPSYWLNKYYTLSNPGIIYQKYLLCHHQKLNPFFSLSQFTEISRQQGERVFRYYTSDSFLLDTVSPCSICQQTYPAIDRAIQQELILLKSLNDRAFEGPWYFISKNWIEKWKAYCTYRSSFLSFPGPIDNSDLVFPVDPPVKSVDYRGVNRHTWQALLVLYGGGPPIPSRSLQFSDTLSQSFSTQYSQPDLSPDQHQQLDSLRQKSLYLRSQQDGEIINGFQ